MKFEYGSKSQEYDASGTVSATKVMLVNSDGASVPVFLAPEKIDLSNSELLELALEVIYQENFPQRAENEKFNTLGEKIAKYDELIEKANEKLKEMDKSLETNATQMSEYATNSEMAQATLLEIVSKLYEKGVLVDEELAKTTITETN